MSASLCTAQASKQGSQPGTVTYFNRVNQSDRTSSYEHHHAGQYEGPDPQEERRTMMQVGTTAYVTVYSLLCYLVTSS